MKSILYTLALFSLVSCTSFQNFTFQFSSSSYERYVASLYKASLDGTSMGQEWIAAGQAALRDSNIIQLPFETTSYFAANRIAAQSYRMNLQAGQTIYIDLRTIPRGIDLFNDLFFYKADRDKYVDLNPIDPEARKLAYNIKNTGAYVLRIQPRLLAGGRYDLKIERDEE
ncbi:MAG: hypothetical protein AAF847_14140 [Bacteroidota bacterium]